MALLPWLNPSRIKVCQNMTSQDKLLKKIFWACYWGVLRTPTPNVSFHVGGAPSMKLSWPLSTPSLSPIWWAWDKEVGLYSCPFLLLPGVSLPTRACVLPLCGTLSAVGQLRLWRSGWFFHSWMMRATWHLLQPSQNKDYIWRLPLPYFCIFLNWFGNQPEKRNA